MKYLGIEESAHIRGSFLASVGCRVCGGRLGYFTSAAGILERCPHCGHKLERVQLSFTAEELAGILNAASGAVGTPRPTDGGRWNARPTDND